jgi:tetratricopeptide (TPR) repeat protein
VVRKWFEEFLAEESKLARRGEYATLRAVLEELAAATDLEPDERALLENNLAWALLESGEPRRAIAMAQAALDVLRREDRWLVSTLRGTIGCALAVSGEPDAAIDLLDDVMAHERNDHPWLASIRLYYRGAALFEVGRVDEALTTWERAHALQPRGIHGQRAHERILQHARGAPPYR